MGLWGAAGLRAMLPRFHDIVARLRQPVGQAIARTPVDQEPHLPVTRTASSESWAMTACAYARHARMSSGTRSG